MSRDRRPLGQPTSLRVVAREEPMRLLKEYPDEERVDYISVGGLDAVILSYTGAEYRQWVRDGRPPMMQTVPVDDDDES